MVALVAVHVPSATLHDQMERRFSGAPAPAPEPPTAAVRKKPLKSLLEFRDVLDALEPRRSDDTPPDQKRKYAQNMSALAAYLIANRLRRTDPFSTKRQGILPAEDGSGLEVARQ
jgi:hypothetical protein